MVYVCYFALKSSQKITKILQNFESIIQFKMSLSKPLQTYQLCYNSHSFGLTEVMSLNRK